MVRSLMLALALAIPAASAQAHDDEKPISTFTAHALNGSQPTAITSGPQDALWATGTAGTGRILKITTDGEISEFVAGLVPGFSVGAEPSGIAQGPDGNLWVTEKAADALLRLTPAGVATEFGGLTVGEPKGITAGPDGRIWFTQQLGGGAIGRIDADGTGLVEFTAGLTPGSDPDAITAGPDGNLWFTLPAADRIGRITPAGVITEFSAGITPARAPTDIAPGPDGALWFTESGGSGGIGRITTSGEVTEYFAGLSPTGTPKGIAAGADGSLWFTKSADPAAIGRISIDGTITEHTRGLDNDADPLGITAGPDGAMWFAESSGTKGRIGRVSLPPTAGATTATLVSTTTARLDATVRPNGSTTTYRFELTPAGGSPITTQDFGAGSGPAAVAVAAQVSGLAAGTQYSARLVATNDAGSSTGAAATFTTEPAPATTPAPAATTTPAPPTASAAALPVIGKSVVLGTESGTVRVREPRAGRYRTLTNTSTVPLGSLIDTARGKVRLTTALPGGKVQRAQFQFGTFSAQQPRGQRGLVEIRLHGGRFASCRASTARAARAPSDSRRYGQRVVRRLWGSDRHGRFRTHGHDSVATVRGTRWLTQDRCDGTLTKVMAGAVDVRPRGSKRSVRVRAGQSFLAKTRR